MHRKTEFLEDLYQFCFTWLDNEPDLSSWDAGDLAADIENRAKQAIEEAEQPKGDAKL